MNIQKRFLPISSLRWQRLFIPMAMLLALTACTSTSPVSDSGLSLSDEPLSGKFVWHDLMTDDPAAAQAFYGSLFGWTFEKATGLGDGNYVVIRNQGRLMGGIVKVSDPPDKDYSRWLPYLSVIDVDKAVAQTNSAGGKTLVSPRDVGRIARAAAVLDPQGAVVGFVRSVAGDPDDSQAPTLGSIVWNELLAVNAQDARRFYQEIHNYGTAALNDSYILIKSQGRNRASILTRPNDSITPQWVTHFAVADPGAAAQRAAELGGTVVMAPNADVRKGSLALVADPSGALLALHQWPEKK